MCTNKFFFFKINHLIFLTIFFIFINLKKNKPKISLFLPIYNKEKYILNCIQNLQRQTLKDIEIIAINDHSSDRSLKILMDLAREDHRIKIVNNDKNRGLLFSRAMGILKSTGEYLMNIDPDDEIKGNNTLEYLYNKSIISKADIITFDIIYKKDNHIYKCENINETLYQPNISNSMFFSNDIIKDCLIWNKLIKKEIFLKAYEFFKEYIYNGKWNYHEDNIWSILVHRYAKSKVCVNKLVYIYNNYNESLINNRFNAIEFQNLIYLHEMYKKIFSLKKDEKYLKAEYFTLFNYLEKQMEKFLLINDNKMKKYFINSLHYFMNHYNCTLEQTKKLKNILSSIYNNIN